LGQPISMNRDGRSTVNRISTFVYPMLNIDPPYGTLPHVLGLLTPVVRGLRLL
jgi:hypothetical protein